MNVVHENANYVIEATSRTLFGWLMAEPKFTYTVRHKLFGVYEFQSPEIAQAITYAEQANAFLQHELWKWIAVQGEKNKEALDKESSVIEFTPADDLLSE